MAGRDRISQLPVDILEMILGYLPLVQVARMAVLSTFWRGIWFSLPQLNFDYDFFYHFDKNYSYDQGDMRTKSKKKKKERIDFWTSASLYVINKVLMQHNGLIRKFVFNFPYPRRNTLRSRSFDINQWLLFVTQKGVEVIRLNFKPEDGYRLPNCIFSCVTLRKLLLWGVSVEQINAHCTLPNVTSICCVNVSFDCGHLSVDVPMLNSLSFMGCDNVSNFYITAQKLDSLAIDNCRFFQLPITLELKSVRILDLDGSSLKDFVNGLTRRGLQLHPPSLNVEYLKLSTNNELMCNNSSAFIHLLQICPKLCNLNIDLMFSDDLAKLSELLHTVAGRHKLLHTLELNSFIGGEDETLFIKGLLVCFPALENVVINPDPIFGWDQDFEKNKEELLHFPCASTKVEIIFQNPDEFD